MMLSSVFLQNSISVLGLTAERYLHGVLAYSVLVLLIYVVCLCSLFEMQLEFLAKFLLYSVQFSSPTSRGMCICSSECSAVYPFGNGFII